MPTVLDTVVLHYFLVVDQVRLLLQMFVATRHPTTRRENASTTKHTYAMPDRVGT